jgi:hypothetical protein
LPPGIFNVLDNWLPGSGPGMKAGTAVSSVQAETNARILQAAINAAQSTGSGCASSPAASATVLIPGHSVVPPPVNPGSAPDAGAEYLLAVSANSGQTAAVVIEPVSQGGRHHPLGRS